MQFVRLIFYEAYGHNVCGAIVPYYTVGRTGNQVKHMQKQGLYEAENEGLTQKFKTSSFVRAVKTSFLQGKDGDAYFTTVISLYRNK